MMPSFASPEVKSVFDAFSATARPKLLRLRQLVLETAVGTDDVGELDETLKWGQPSYQPRRPNVGTPVRISEIKGAPDRIGLFVHCQTTLVSTYRELYGDLLTFDGNRCIVLDVEEPLPEEALRHCIRLALTYHLGKRADGLPF